jgi:hypothetical protein
MAKKSVFGNRKYKKQVQPLVTADNVRSGRIFYKSDRENIVGRMDDQAKMEAKLIIRNRYDSAKDQTMKMRDLMADWDLQYKSVFVDGEDADERIFLPKTREAINTVRAFLISVISNMNPIVTMQPMLQSANTIWASKSEWERAKLAEALVQFYFDDMWKITDDYLPRFLTHFLKYSLACFKVTYYETDYDPDLLLDVVDRAFLYIDPNVNRLDQSRWIIEEYFITKTEVEERYNRGDWIIDDKDKPVIDGTITSTEHDVNLQRYFGENFTNNVSVNEDELIQCFDYWQYPRDGLKDLYATVIGGIDGPLVRYGRNPFPFKGNNYIACSYNPDDRPDGQGLAELQEPHQTVINTLLNFRLDDIRKNIQRAAFVPEQMVSSTTQKDLHDGNSIVRVNQTFLETIISNGGNINNFIGELPSGTSTRELFQDLDWMLGQSRESSQTPQVFQGFDVAPGTPLGIVQEQLNRTVGSFQPIVRQLMRVFEKLADVMVHYFKSPEFFPNSRIITIVGRNKYEQAVSGWHQVPGANASMREVSPDEMMNVNVTFNAVNAADAYAARTMQVGVIREVFQAIGQVPEIAGEISSKINFPRLVEQMLMVGGHDIDGLLMTPEEQQAKQQQEQQRQQQAFQQQQQMIEFQTQQAAQLEQMKGQIQSFIESAKGEIKEKTQTSIDQARIQEQSNAKLEETIAQIVQQTIADMKIETHKVDEEMRRETHEAKLEKQAGVVNTSSSGGGNIQADGGN